MNRRKTDYERGPTPLFKFVVLYCLACALIAFGVFIYNKEEPEVISSYCIDGIVVIADDQIIGCVNGEQAAENINWTP